MKVILPLIYMLSGSGAGTNCREEVWCIPAIVHRFWQRVFTSMAQWKTPRPAGC